MSKHNNAKKILRRKGEIILTDKGASINQHPVVKKYRYMDGGGVGIVGVRQRDLVRRYREADDKPTCGLTIVQELVNGASRKISDDGLKGIEIIRVLNAYRKTWMLFCASINRGVTDQNDRINPKFFEICIADVWGIDFLIMWESMDTIPNLV